MATKQTGYCNNCGRYGHVFHQCKTPITSYGIIAYRRKPSATPESASSEIEYLMIRRRDTLGFIDFMRGKYSVYDKSYILNMIIQMTVSEKARLLNDSFDTIWCELWGETLTTEQYRSEEYSSREKFGMLRSGILMKDDYYTLETLVEMSREHPMWNVNPDTITQGNTETGINEWEFAEWGFPKGRRNYQEKDYECAVREFCEETGFPEKTLIPIKNLLPFDEIFTGSNYKSYKHTYYLTYMPYDASQMPCTVQSSEVSCSEWKSFEECLKSIRYYNVEKIRVLTNIHRTICSSSNSACSRIVITSGLP